MKSDLLTEAAAAVHSPHVQQVVTGRDIAHSDRYRTVGQRALLAADVLEGRVRLEDLTQGQIARLLRVSTQSVREAQRINGDAELRELLECGAPLHGLLSNGNGSLVEDCFKASPAELAELGRVLSPSVVWDMMIIPNIA